MSTTRRRVERTGPIVTGAAVVALILGGFAFCLVPWFTGTGLDGHTILGVLSIAAGGILLERVRYVQIERRDRDRGREHHHEGNHS